MRRVGLILGLVGAVAPGASAQASGGLGPVVGALETLIREDSVVGAAAVLVRDGRIVSHAELGLADRAKGTKVDQGTIFHWASITRH